MKPVMGYYFFIGTPRHQGGYRRRMMNTLRIIWRSAKAFEAWESRLESKLTWSDFFWGLAMTAMIVLGSAR